MNRTTILSLLLSLLLAPGCSGLTEAFDALPGEDAVTDGSSELSVPDIIGDATVLPDSAGDTIQPDMIGPDLVVPDVYPDTVDLVPDICVSDCTDRDCGDDGCGGSCGDCSEMTICSEIGTCVPLPCQSSKDCPGDFICFKEMQICVECAVDDDCLEGKLCNPSYECYEPLYCDSDKDCKDYDMVCNKDSGLCVECLAHPDCPDEHYCKDFFCFPNACKPEQSQCAGNVIQLCAEDGSVWLDQQTCPETDYCEEASCHPKTCIPETKTCLGNVIQICDELGKEINEEIDCAIEDLVCVAGECLDLTCAPGQNFCDDPGTLAHCDDEGLAYETEACPDGTYCKIEACVPQICVPGEPICKDMVIAADCDSFGSGPGKGGTDCSDDGKCCLAGECIDPPAELCDDLDNNCNGEIDESCDDDEDGWCDADLLVIGNPPICPQGPGDCDDTQADINPLAEEQQGDGLDNDCDGKTDEVEACPGTCTGHTVEAYLCALELCLEPPVVSAEFVSPTNDNITTAWEAVAHFGNPNNDLAPWAGDSYGLLASGPAAGTAHSSDLPAGTSTSDPFSKDGYSTFDNVEFRLKLTAPQNALGFSIDYIFFSVEYEEYIGTSFNDKFYIFLKAPDSTDNTPTVINQTQCSNPDSYYDLIDPITGDKLCYIAINTAFSEPCSDPQTNILGTGFECGPADSSHGSSTGWLTTSWAIMPGEAFDLTFHIHDTSDGIFDSEVILDNFQWLYVPFLPGTHKK
jgi:hypothetical protein